jgi:hypothetical protein
MDGIERRLPQPYPRSSAVLGDELDAGRFEGGTDGGGRRGARNRFTALEPGQRAFWHQSEALLVDVFGPKAGGDLE